MSGDPFASAAAYRAKGWVGTLPLPLGRKTPPPAGFTGDGGAWPTTRDLNGEHSMKPKAIETSYAGHRFRSRLEARWAVAFDALGVRWQYEVEGYECGTRLSWSDRTIKYLPDFWLPDLGTWAEVKGAWGDERAAKDWLHCVADLSGNYSTRGDAEFFLLGEIGVAPAAFRMHMAIPSGGAEWPYRVTGKAVDRARAARFEHGESGA